MLKYKSTDDTICALATPPGHGGIGVVRVCGPKSREFCQKLIKTRLQHPSHTAFLASIYNVEQTAILDECVVTYFAKDKSYTGDETMEISFHGSPVIAEEILQNLILAGCRSAERGEFTFRAFMSGKIDLLQAESIHALIASETKKAAEVSLRQLKGELSSRAKNIKEKVIYLLAHLEADIDFATEGLETISAQQACSLLAEIKNEILKLTESYAQGKVLTEAYTVALVGEPNVGKSSLFNAFVQDDRAIVTEIAGTTRDAIEGFRIISGIKVKFVDTAGLRTTDDVVEKIGIQKTKEQIQNADLVFYVLDGSAEDIHLDRNILAKYGSKIVFVVNKIDVPTFNQNFIQKMLNEFNHKVFFLSAKKAETLSEVTKSLEEGFKKTFHESTAVVLKARQFELLNKAQNCFLRAEELLNEDASREFAAFELRDGLENMMDLLGEKFSDQVLEKVFQEFCIGK
jgi:tRNA modification GTPase